MLKAVIFDFDGVIADSEVLHFRAFNEVLKDHGFQIGRPDYYRHYLGLSDRDCFTTLIEEGRLALDKDRIPDLTARKKQVYKDMAQTEGHVIEGVRPFLERLAAAGLLRAICSGALQAEIELVLDQANLRHHFSALVAADHVQRGKPDPEGYLLTLKQLQTIAPALQAKNCVVVEDSQWGLTAARAAGMATLAVTNSYPADQLHMADKVVAHLDEVTVTDLQGLCR